MFSAGWERREQREISRRIRAAPVEPGSRPRPDLPVGEDLLPKIKHIVVLMMENHSYDNYLGTLDGRGEGLPLGDGRHARLPRTRAGRAARVRRIT